MKDVVRKNGVLRIQRGERIQLPKEFMKKNNLKYGDYVIIEVNGKLVVVRPAEVRATA